MAFNQFISAALNGSTLHVDGQTEAAIVDRVTAITVAVGRIHDDGTLPASGFNLLQRRLTARRLESPWVAEFDDVPAEYAKGTPVILIGVATGDFADGDSEIWYERAEIE